MTEFAISPDAPTGSDHRTDCGHHPDLVCAECMPEIMEVCS